MELILRDIMVSLTTPTAIELLVCIGKEERGQPISIRFWGIGTISLAGVKRAPSSASEADDMTNLIIWVMVKMGPLQLGTGSSLAQEDVGYRSAAVLGFIMESRIIVHIKNHISVSVDDTIFRVSGQVVE